MKHNTELSGEPLSNRDNALMETIRSRLIGLGRLDDYERELTELERIGKHELQYLYGHPDGITFLAERFIPQEVLRSNAVHL